MLDSSLLSLGQSLSRKVLNKPTDVLHDVAAEGAFHAHIEIPYHHRRLAESFERKVESCRFAHLGVVITFENEASLSVFDDSLVLDNSIKDLINQFGVVVFRNVRLQCSFSDTFQKNIFPDLMFHVDRGPNFDNQYSLFYRNPDDPLHEEPRTTSTLVISNDAARLLIDDDAMHERATQGSILLFERPMAEKAIGEYVVEQRWDAPRSAGELCIFDNRTVMHASYHRHQHPGYKIAVQYLY